jgi:hypothetical protein
MDMDGQEKKPGIHLPADEDELIEIPVPSLGSLSNTRKTTALRA